MLLTARAGSRSPSAAHACTSLPGPLPHRAQRPERTVEACPRLFRELAARGGEKVLAVIRQSLGDGPGAGVAMDPEGAAGMREQHLEAPAGPAVEQDPRAYLLRLCHAVIIVKAMTPALPSVLAIIGFAFLIITLTAVARRLPVPTPILQVAAGLLVGLLPGSSLPALDPDLVFFVFLPPILWSAAFFTSLRDFTAHLRSIGMLAVALVLVTAIAVAVAARALMPGLPWAGGTGARRDRVAAGCRRRRRRSSSRLPVPRRVIMVLERREPRQ